MSNAVAKEIDIRIPETDIDFSTKIPNILACNINYSISRYGMVNVSLIDINGREIQSLTNNMLSPGNYNIKMNK